MPSFTYLTAALALTSSVVASPVEKRDAFSIQQVARGLHRKNGPAQMVKTLRKYGKAVPESLQTAADNNAAMHAESDNGSVPAVPVDAYDAAYLSPVTVGSNTLHLDLDTGSADLWVFSSLQSESSLAGHDYYVVDPAKRKAGYTWRITYGDGSGASGQVYVDKVTVAAITATSQAVEAATTVSAEFSKDVDIDGLLGLAMSSLNTIKPQPQKTWFDNVKSSLAKPLFAVNLKYHAAGTYDFGYIDSSKYTGAITYVAADASQGFWGFTASGYSIGSGATTASSIDGILDTGTTLMYVPTSVAKAYYAKVSGAKLDNEQGGYTVPCSATLPNFSITVGGVKQTVPGKHINYAPINRSTCFGGLQPNTGIGFSIFGDIFLKSKYIVHDMSKGSPRLGFAQQAGVSS